MSGNTHLIIMAGGIGSRFWPLSTPEYPKQFVDVMGMGKSLIQMTVERFQGICSNEHIWVVTNQSYVETVKEQLPGIPAEFGWSDLGNWASLYGLLPKDEQGNAAVGNVSLYDCKDCVVQVGDAKSVVLQGLDSFIVAEKNGQLLV